MFAQSRTKWHEKDFSMNTAGEWSDEPAAHDEDIDIGDVTKPILALLF
jgi:hypothetical protein